MIRTFQNSDLPVLHQLWIEHWSAIGMPPAVRLEQFEQAVLARTFFRSDDLLIAEKEGVPRGWLHLCRSPDDSDRVVVPAICLGTGAELSLGAGLLDEALRRITAMNARRVQLGVVRDDLFGYAGLDPVGHGTGIPSSDGRLSQLLESAGFQPACRALAMRLTVPGFRPPFSRESLQYRRTTHVKVGAFRFRDPRHAAGMSHLDVESHSLVERSGPSLAELHLWLSDPEAEVMNPSLAILDLGEAAQRGRMDAAEFFLLGAAIQSAEQRSILSLETSIDESNQELRSQLQMLRFLPSTPGACWEREC